MNKTACVRMLGLVGILGGLGLGAGVARAGLGATCVADADCGVGLVCEVVGGTACACPEGGDCPACDTTETKACVPGPCASDSDCGADAVCVSYEIPCAVAMPMPACAPGQECPPPDAPPACTNETKSVCAPKWTQPCKAAADCGAGFTCDAEDVCSCSGSGSSGSSGGATPPTPADAGAGGSSDPAPPSGEMPIPPDDGCTCAPSDVKVCHPEATVCTSDSACPAGWTCEMSPSVTTCASDPSGATPACDAAPPAPTEGECYPAGYAGVGGVYEATRDAAEASAHVDDGSNTAPTTPGVPGTSASGGGCAGAGEAPAWLALAVVGLGFARRRVVRS